MLVGVAVSLIGAYKTDPSDNVGVGVEVAGAESSVGAPGVVLSAWALVKYTELAVSATTATRDNHPLPNRFLLIVPFYHQT